MKIKKIDLIVTRHKALLKLIEEFFGEDVVKNAELKTHIGDPNELNGKIVVGNLPLNLASRCEIIISPVLKLKPEDRGKELDFETLKDRFEGFEAYKVEKVQIDIW